MSDDHGQQFNLGPFQSNNNMNIFQNILETNQSSLVQAYESQNKNNYAESVNSLEKIYKNFHFLGMMVDQIPFTTSIIRENREILSQAHLDKLSERFPSKINNYYEYEKTHHKSNGKKKQKKTKWTPEEQKLFLEDLKKVSEHVRTRSINQVRSHLQKHQLKEKKLKKRGNENSTMREYIMEDYEIENCNINKDKQFTSSQDINSSSN